MSDLNYEGLARLAYETWRTSRRENTPPDQWVRGLPGWVGLDSGLKKSWIDVVQAVTGAVAAADLV